MREWLSKLPLVGHMFETEVPVARRIEPTSNPQLNAERQRSQKLEQRLQEVQDREASLVEEVERLTRQGADNEKSLRALEEMLADPDRAQNAIVYYQLREIWFSCNKELDQLVKELARHMEKEERHQQLARFKTEQEEEAKRLEQELKDVEDEHRYVVERRRKLEQDLSRSQHIWHYFKRKNLEGELEATRLEMAPVEQQLEDCRRRIREVQDRAAPAYEGLSVEGRRQINLAAIALAQYLFLRFQKDSVVDMARSARNKAIHEAYFGPADECLQIMRLLKEVSGRWRADRERGEKVRRRSRFLRSKVSYKEKMQTVPDLRSVDQLQPSISEEGQGAGEVNPIPVNVLEMDLWDMRRVFL
jgi:DNA repair exonuclease SbcCD ATPase subunit